LADRAYEPDDVIEMLYMAAAGVVIVSYFLLSKDADWGFAEWATVSGIATGLCALGAALTKLDKHLIQKRRDRSAGKILTELREDPGRPPRKRYVLYLRPFFTTGLLAVENKEDFKLPIQPGYFEQKAAPWISDLEAIFALALEPEGELACLGRPGEQFGAGRAVSDDERWQVDVEMLARHAHMIVILPSERPGTAWEIAHLKEKGHLGKTIFLMPQEVQLGAVSIRDVWTRTVAHYGEQGITLPEYQPTGLLFRIDGDGRIGTRRRLDLSSHRNLRKACRELAGLA
jgi:hypothetical protein